MPINRRISPGIFIQTHYYEKINFKKPDRRKKISEDDFTVPSYKEWHLLETINHNVSQLKKMARVYKQKVSGNKNQLVARIYNYLKLSYYARKIQLKWHDYLRRKFNRLKGEACFHRQCTNSTDFLTLNKVEKIPYNQFFSYKDDDGFIYGFNIKSIYNLKEKNAHPTTNPYNRKILPHKVLENVDKYIHLSKLLGEHVLINLQDKNTIISKKKKLELRAISLFHKIDSFGHITDSQWFMNLHKPQLIRFIRELFDIWNYRAQLAISVKCLICPPNGRPFMGINLGDISTRTEHDLKKKNIICN